MENNIHKKEYLTCGTSCFPQIVVKANEQDILNLTSSWREMIAKYPNYSSSIGLTAAASPENVDPIIEEFGSDIDFYDQPIVIGCFACKMDNDVIIDTECAHPLNMSEQAFVIERILKSNPEIHCENVLIVIPDSDFPEPLVAIMDQLLDILSFDTESGIVRLADYEQIFAQADELELSHMIDTTMHIRINPNEIASKANLRDLATALYLKLIMSRLPDSDL